MKFPKAKKEKKIIIKSEEELIPDCYRHPSRSLGDFALTAEARAEIEARRRQRRKETEELLADLGLGPRKEWWESD
jgi:hypothetical protein